MQNLKLVTSTFIVANQDFKLTLISRSYSLSLKGIALVDSVNKKDWSAEILVKQLIRSITSIGANIIEAQAASSPKDFINFLNHALKSANESEFWLSLLRDSHKVHAGEIDSLLNETNQLARILGSSIKTLKNKNNKQFKI